MAGMISNREPCYLSGVRLNNPAVAMLTLAASALLAGCAYTAAPLRLRARAGPAKRRVPPGPVRRHPRHRLAQPGPLGRRHRAAGRHHLAAAHRRSAAAGRTTAELRNEISQRLKTFIKDESATVTVAVSAINSYRFVVSGNVERPGAFSANHFVTVSEAIALTGGPDRFAESDRDRHHPQRREPARPAASRSTTRRSWTASTPSTICRILPGDLIYIP